MKSNTVSTVFEFEDTFETPEPIAEAVKTVENGTESQREPELQNPEQPNEPTSPSGDVEVREGLSRFLNQFKEDGLLPTDAEIPAEVDIETAKQLVWSGLEKDWKAKESEFLAEREAKALDHIQSLGYTDAHFAYVDHLMAGGSQEVVHLHSQYAKLATASLDSEEKQLAIIRAAASIQGIEPEYIDSYIGTLSTPEAILEAAKKAQNKISAEAQKLAQTDTDRINREKDAERQATTQWQSNIKAGLSKEIMGMKLPKPEQDSLADFILKPSVVRTVQTPQGPVRETLTPYEAAQEDIEGSIEKTLAHAIFIKGGMTGLVNAAHKASGDKFLQGFAKLEKKEQEAVEEKFPMGEGLTKSRNFTIEV